jgi:hypothetical protein
MIEWWWWCWRWFLEQLVETEVLGGNLPRRHFVHHKTPHDRPGLEPRTAAVGSQRLTAWAMARPFSSHDYLCHQCESPLRKVRTECGFSRTCCGLVHFPLKNATGNFHFLRKLPYLYKRILLRHISFASFHFSVSWRVFVFPLHLILPQNCFMSIPCKTCLYTKTELKNALPCYVYYFNASFKICVLCERRITKAMPHAQTHPQRLLSLVSVPNYTFLLWNMSTSQCTATKPYMKG